MSISGYSKNPAIGAVRLALFAGVLIACLSAKALAHAVLVDSDPSDGAMLSASPERLALTFNEPVSPLVIRLIGPAGQEHLLKNVSTEGPVLSIVPADTLGDGTHLLSWRVVSADGHPVGSTLTFSVAHKSQHDLPSSTETSATARIAIWGTRVVLYTGLFIGAGGAFFVIWMAGNPHSTVRRLLYVSMGAGLVVAPVSVGLLGVDLLGTSLVHLAGHVVWRAGAQSAYIATATFAFVAFLSGILALRTASHRAARCLSAFALASAGFAIAMSGHASTASPQILMRPAVFVHAVSLAFWIGALVPLAGLLFEQRRDARAVLSCFSRMVPLAIVLLITSGTVLTVVQVGESSALWRTDYGRLLLIKAGLLTIIFSIVLHNRLVLTRRVMVGTPSADRALARAILFEVVLVLVVLSVVATWRFTPPPRALAVTAAAPVTVHMHSPRMTVDVRIDPGRPGSTTVSVVLATGESDPPDAREVLLNFSKADESIQPIRRSAKRADDETWHVDDLFIPVSGEWTIRVDVLISDFEMVSLHGHLVL